MLVVISPAKTLDYKTPAKTQSFTTPDYLDQSQILIDRLRQLSSLDISELMNVSSKIANLNFDRYEAWQSCFNQQNAKQAVLAFKGDVYTGLDADNLSVQDLKHAQKHLRILSGLYGLLRPLDLMMPYRLEMGTRLDNERGKNLYEFWGMEITKALNEQLETLKSECLINLASIEYFKSVKSSHINGRVITPAFKEYKNGQYKMIGVYAKKARGLLSRYIIENRLSDPNDIRAFDWEGYVFNPSQSSNEQWVFTRRQV
ncbi:MAG: peroxide stress protein YaaA [Gammaproteobacteria bacterium]|nr:peroxide stress protein YaaA [Gammaproteobacteria bacterium]